MLLLTGSASAQWTVEYQREKTDTYYGIAFPSATVGYICGAGGSILKTIDGGSTWVPQTSPVPDSFFDVFFLDVDNGWIVGDNGVIVYTTDGGANWYEHAQSGALTTADLNTVYFVDSYGWTGGDSEDIFRTTDGGTTWYLAEALPSSSEVEGISFVDTLIGYAAVDGDGVIYSTDGGLNWTDATTNFGPFSYSKAPDVEEIFTIDDTTAVATGWGSMVGYQPMVILVSYDAGVTWNCPDITYPWNTYCYGYGIDMFDDGEMIIIGGGGGFAAANVHSSDLTNWYRTPEFYGANLRDCAVIPGTNTVMAVGDDGLIATSTNRGLDWSYNYDPSFGFRGVTAFTNAGTTTLAVGGNGMFMKKEAASPWTQPKLVSPNGFAPTFHDIAYAGGKIYASGTYDYFAVSDDMGATWTELYTVTSLYDGIYGMSWHNDTTAVLVGELNRDDVVYITTDGGVTRTTIWHNVFGEQFNDVHFANGQDRFGVIGAENNGLFYTIDGGLNWTQGTEDIGDSAEDIDAVFMPDLFTAWGVGTDGLIVKSEDGGANWLQQPTWQVDLDYNDVHFNNLNGHGWIVGQDQIARMSVDGGVTWVDMAPVLELPTDDVYSVYLNKETNKLYIGGAQAMIQYWDNAPTDSDTPISLPFALNQNYPNPFNPSTTISFTLDRDGFVSLNVYDVAGRAVATILNKEMTAGSYDIGFNANGLSSGVYFYKLKTAEKEMTRKMILLR
jgi:photosystem II stability/assembly factor-like uncharacterized protein